MFRNILLIPGPLTTSPRVKSKLTIDYSAREPIFTSIIQSVRKNLLLISDTNKDKYTSILVQGSGTYGNESVISSLPSKSKISVFSNGVYGDRLKDMCSIHNKLNDYVSFESNTQVSPSIVEETIKNSDSTHVALVHNETTTGIMNPIESIIPIAKKYNKKIILDAISSYGGIPIDIDGLDIDYLVGSSNKCLHSHPGLAFVISKKDSLIECKDTNNSLSLDLYSQYIDLENENQFRFTPPVQIINSLNTSLDELIINGGIQKRYEHYTKMNTIIYNTLTDIGFVPYLDKEINSPIVSTYYIPDYINNFNFDTYSKRLRIHNIVLYPSPLNKPNIIRIGNIGDITIDELHKCLNIMMVELMKFN